MPSSPSVTMLVGNPRPQSRTLALAMALADRIVAEVSGHRGPTVDLSRYGAKVFEDDEGQSLARSALADSDVIVVASPTYKASFTGLLKVFLDRYEHRALTGVMAIPLMTGNSMGHAMSPDTQLRPVLIELGASVPTTSMYVDMSRFTSELVEIDQWAQTNERTLTVLRRGITLD